MLSRLTRRVDLAVVTALTSFLVFLGASRAWLLWNTGVLVSDEYGYLASAWYGQTENVVLGFRYAFAELNILLFRLLGVGNMDRAVVAFPFYLALWPVITLLSVWSLLRLLGFKPGTIALTLVFLVMTPTFLFLSAAFFTESMSLAFASAGVYFLVRSIKFPSLPSGPLCAFISAGFLWLAMRSREPYGLLFLGAFLVVMGQLAVSRENRRKLLAVLLIFLLVGIASYYVTDDPVSQETIGSAARFVQGFESLFLAAPVAFTTTSTTTSPTVTFTTIQVTTVTGTGTGTTVTITSGPPNIGVNTTTTTTTGTGPPLAGGPSQFQTQGILAILGIHFIPSSAILRVALLTLVSFVTGFGPLLAILVAGALFLFYDMTFGGRLRRWLPIALLCFLIFGSLGGVMLVFANSPNYFGIQQYSTLLRFANTSVLILPLLAAPFLERIASHRLAKILLVCFVLITYAGSLGFLAQAAVTNLNPFENPLTLTPPTGWHVATVTLRQYAQAHPTTSYLVVGFHGDPQVWAPGLTNRPELNFTGYLNDSALARVPNQHLIIYIFAGTLSSLWSGYHATWQLATDAIAGNQTSVDGFRVTGVLLNGDSGTMITVSRV